MPRLSPSTADVLATLTFPFAVPFLRLAATKRHSLRLARRLQDLMRVTVLSNHFTEPTIGELDSRERSDRFLPGIDFNLEGQADLLRRFVFAPEITALEGANLRGRIFKFANGFFGAGDAEALYSVVRLFKPERLIEVGAGYSTLVIAAAAAENAKEDPSYKLDRVCFDPSPPPWLDRIGVDDRRQPVESADLSNFMALTANDVLFIDSSHTLRAQGDVEAEILRIVPSVRPGVLIHFHDIFSPRDYPADWLYERRILWTEQYVLEAFLSFNSAFEVLLSLNHLHRRGSPELGQAFPILAATPDAEPGSFWIRRL